jgi:hypothetical protein
VQDFPICEHFSNTAGHEQALLMNFISASVYKYTKECQTSVNPKMFGISLHSPVLFIITLYLNNEIECWSLVLLPPYDRSEHIFIASARF